MATALRKGSAKSFGSFVDLNSVSSSEFEPIDLEELDLRGLDEMQNDASNQPGNILGKTTTPPPGVIPLQSVQEQAESRSESDNALHQVTDPLQDGFQNLENATHKAAEMAKDFTSKLWTTGASEAKSSVMKLAGDVSSWWATLDPAAAQASASPQNSARGTQASEEVQELFGLSETEELMESFKSTVVQTMECRHNTFSKPQQVRAEGKLYITDKNTCFSAEGIRFAILHKDIKKAAKANAGRFSEALELRFGAEGAFVVFDEFKGTDLDSALGLLEHLTS